MQIIKLDAIDSTNRYLADLVSKIPLKDYAVVVAQYQSAGQGQRGSNWQSEKGKNLIISILKKNIEIKSESTVSPPLRAPYQGLHIMEQIARYHNKTHKHISYFVRKLVIKRIALKLQFSIITSSI